MIDQIPSDAYTDLVNKGKIGPGSDQVAPGNQYTQQGYVLLEDQKAQNTPGGQFLSGAWYPRALNTIVAEKVPAGASFLVSLFSDRFILEAGTYMARGSAPAYRVGRHQSRVQNISDGTTLLLGTSESIDNANLVGNRSFFQGTFTIAAGKSLEVQHQCETTFANGFGIQANFDTEVYTTIEIFKLIVP